MKYLLTLLLVFSMFFADLKGSVAQKLLTVGASLFSAYPLIKEGYAWAKLKKNRDHIISILPDADEQVSGFIREHLKSNQYSNAQELPIKVSQDDSFTIEAQLDSFIRISKNYETSIKESINNITEPDAQKDLGAFKIILDHEMFHIQDQHAKQSINAKMYIPLLVEGLLFPLSLKLINVKNPFTFVAGVAASISVKRFLFEHIENFHRKNQELKADNWAIKRNDNIDDLNAFMQTRVAIVRQGFAYLYMEYMQNGSTQSKAFNILVKLFSPKIDFDKNKYENDPEYQQQCFEKMQNLYENFEQMPAKWPLRLLQYAHDPHHPFALDDEQRVETRINELEAEVTK